MSAVDAAQPNEAPEFARLVKSLSANELREVMRGERRKQVLDDAFGRMPGQFRGERAADTEAVIHWCVGGRSDGGVDVYELVISGGTCVLSVSPGREPRLALTLGAAEFLRLVTGTVSPVTLFMTGKLKAKGDLGLATSFSKIFDIPRL